MKKKILPGLIGFVFLLVASGVSFAGAPLAEFMRTNQLNTLEQYVDWLGNNVYYKSDNGSREWANPQETLARKYGDCKDYAVLNKEALRALGYNAEIYSVTFSSQDKHAICVFKINGSYAMISNAELYTTNISDWAEFQQYLFMEHGYFLPKIVL